MRTRPHANEPKNLGAFPARLWHLWESFWALPAVMIVVLLGLAFLLSGGPGRDVSQWLWDGGAVLAQTIDGATETLSVLVGVNAAFTTLYFSITLLVLTIAAGNLGVRLIDRWIARTFVRTTLGLLLGATAASLFVLMLLDGASDGADLPHAAIGFLGLLAVVEFVWLAVALNDLGRAIFVDTAIAKIGSDARSADVSGLQPVLLPEWPDATPLRADTRGYIVGTDIAKMSARMGEWDNRLRLERAAGDVVMPGEIIAWLESPLDDEQAETLRRLFTVGATRSDQEGLSFRVRLLVEMAARALSPAVNDFYTARACVDTLASVMADQHHRLVPPGHVLMEIDRVMCPTAGFQRLFDAPVAALRQAAADYPSIVIRFIERLGVAAACVDRPAFTHHLADYARAMAEHGSERAEVSRDADAIGQALQRAFPAGPATPLRAAR